MAKSALLAALLIGGCSPEAQNARGRSALEARAAFDLACPHGSLSLVPLGRNADGVVTSYGVQGCGMRATYVRLSDATWLMNPAPGARPQPTRGPPGRVRIPVQTHPPAPPPTPTAPPSTSAEPAPSGSAERGRAPRPPSSLKPHPGEPEPRLPDLPGHGEAPSPL